MNSNNAHLTAQNVTMEALAKYLSRNGDVGKLVVDKSELSGHFTFKLDWLSERSAASQDASSENLPSIFVALQQQLGLKLTPAKILVSAIVIDSAEKPEQDN